MIWLRISSLLIACQASGVHLLGGSEWLEWGWEDIGISEDFCLTWLSREILPAVWQALFIRNRPGPAGNGLSMAHGQGHPEERGWICRALSLYRRRFLIALGWSPPSPWQFASWAVHLQTLPPQYGRRRVGIKIQHLHTLYCTVNKVITQSHCQGWERH